MYGGIAGIGKTSLVLRLAKETRQFGLKGAIYMPLWPGEAIASILARVEAIIGEQISQRCERNGRNTPLSVVLTTGTKLRTRRW